MSGTPRIAEVHDFDVAFAPAIAVRPREAARLLSVSRDMFDMRIAPQVAVIDLGRVKLYAVSALRDWARSASSLPTPKVRTNDRKWRRKTDAPELIPVLLRDPCAYCGCRSTSIDHIQPQSRGGTHSWANLTAACHHCNQSKSARPLLTHLLRRRAT